MRIQTITQDFFSRYVTFPERIILMLLVFGAILGFGLITLNHFDFEYTVASWNYQKMLSFGVLFSIFVFWGMYIKEEAPRSATFLWGFGLYFWSFVITSAITQGVQATPFPPIDEYLVKADQWFGIHTTSIMAWTHAHPRINHGLTIIYYTLVWELLVIPAVLICVNARHTLTIFFLAVLFSFYIGVLIYYFFPTMAPSGIFHSPYFTKSQHATSLSFFQVHHHLKVTDTNGGLIAFPSFHVIWAIILTYCCRAKKYFFYPVLVYNFILICATVLLGWHYLVDVLGGAALAVTGIYVAEKFSLCRNRSNLTRFSF